MPGSTEVLGILENVVVQEGFPTEILPVIPASEHWSEAGITGSLTILVNGENPFPAECHSTRATSCKIYATPEGPKNHPTTTMVREALAERSSEKSLADHRRISPRP